MNIIKNSLFQKDNAWEGPQENTNYNCDYSTLLQADQYRCGHEQVNTDIEMVELRFYNIKRNLLVGCILNIDSHASYKQANMNDWKSDKCLIFCTSNSLYDQQCLRLCVHTAKYK